MSFATRGVAFIASNARGPSRALPPAYLVQALTRFATREQHGSCRMELISGKRRAILG